MKKHILIFALLAGVTLTAFGQSTPAKRWSIGLEAGAPVGDASNGYNLVIGASLKYEIPITTTIALTLSVGRNTFLGKAISGHKIPTSDGLPLKAGMKYHFTNSFYGEAQAGTVFYGDIRRLTAFVYAAGVGYDFNNRINMGLRYENWAKNGNGVFGTGISADGPYGQIGVRLAYSF